MRDLHPVADAVGSARPAGVDQPAVDLVLGDFLAQQVGVDRRMQSHEGRSETGAENGRRFAAHSPFGPGDLGGVSGNEMIHGLLGGQLGHRRHDAVRVAGQHDHVFGMTAAPLRHRIADVRERIAGAGVFREAGIVEVQPPRVVVHHHVFQQGAEAPGAFENFRFRFPVELDHLGVTAALEIEHAIFAPAVFVVADQLAGGVRRQGGFTRSRQAEKDGGVSLGSHVGRTVHG